MTEKAPTPMGRAIGITMANTLLSCWGVIYGKYVLEMMPASNIILLVQNFVTIFTLLLLRLFGVVKDPGIGLSLPPTFKVQGLIALLYTGNVLFGLLSLRYLTVPMYSVLKRGTIPVVFFGELFLLRKLSVLSTLPSIVVMLAGSCVAAYFDLYFSALGYTVGLMSCVSQSAALMASTRFMKGRDAELGIVYFNAVVSSLCIIPTIYFFFPSEVGVLTERVASVGAPLVFHLVGNGLSIAALNYSIFLNCNVNSPLTVGITGQLKTVLQIFLGILFFGKMPSPLSFVGVVLNTVGCAWYAVVKYRQQYAAKAQAAHAPRSV